MNEPPLIDMLVVAAVVVVSGVGVDGVVVDVVGVVAGMTNGLVTPSEQAGVFDCELTQVLALTV